MFHKVAFPHLDSVGTATFDAVGQQFHRIARNEPNAAELGFTGAAVEASQRRSYYLDGARKIDVAGKLREASTKYDISPHPSDYIYEAIRANSVNVPNDNHDAFSKAELLRFDHQRKMAVYLTYEGKPHHLNHRCFREGTPVVMADGTSKSIELVQDGDEVLDRNGMVQKVEAAWCEGVPDTLTKVRTKNYGTFFATSNHEFPVWAWPRKCACGCGEDVNPGRAYKHNHYKQGRVDSDLKVIDGSTKRNGGLRRIPKDYDPIKRIPIGDARPGDWLFIPQTSETSATDVTPAQARLLGYYTAEGCASTAKWTSFTFGFHEEKTWCKDVQELCASIGVATRTVPDFNRGTFSVQTSNPKGEQLQKWFVSEGGRYSTEKRLSREVMSWPKGLKIELLRGWIRGDGSQFFRSMYQNSHAYTQFVGALTTTSPHLASQARVLLHQIGIPSTVCLQKPNKTRKHTAYQIRIHGWYATKLARLIWGEAALADERPPLTAANQVRDSGEHLLVPIVSVETVPNDLPVYNLTISGSHSYQINNGLATFNSSDPRRARGVILDAHYNDDAPALEHCPTCNHRTAEATERDPSGLHCSKCGSVVKDEYIEILVAVDTKKDPALIRGIQAGLLNAGSMGCSCSSTVCNVCDHVARSVQDFCTHIRGAAKGSLWLKSGSEFKRITAEEVRKLARTAGLTVPSNLQRLIDVYLRIPGTSAGDGFEIRKAFEYCQGVDFEEYSRVHKPADPKAHTIELLKAASANGDLSLEQETEQLINWARLARLSEQSMPKTALSTGSSPQSQTFHIARINGDDEHLCVQASFDELQKTLRISAQDSVEYAQVHADSLSQAIVRATKSAQYLPITSDVSLVVPDGVQLHLDQNGMPMNHAPAVGPGGAPAGPGGMPGAPGGPKGPGGAPTTIEDLTQQEMNPAKSEQSPEEFGMLPPGAEAPGEGDEAMHSHAEGDEDEHESPYAAADEGSDMKEEKYASVYGDFEVDVFDDGATLLAPSGEIFSVKSGKVSAPNAKLASNADKLKFGNELIDSVMSDGLVRTALKYKAEFSKRFADSVEGAMFDFQGGRPMSDGGALEGAMSVATEQHEPGKDVPVVGGATEGGMETFANESRPMPTNSVESRDTDMQDEAQVASPKTNATDGAEDVNKEKRPKYTVRQDAISGGTSDMAGQAGVGPGGRKADVAPAPTPPVGEASSTPATASATKTASTATVLADPAVQAKIAELTAALERQTKLHASKLERMQTEHDAEKEALEKSYASRFARALKVASKRGQLNIEVSPLKAKMLDSLTVPRPIGRSAMTGQQMQYTGVDEQLGLHLVEAAWAESAEEEVEHLIHRASEIMSYDDKYLISVEQDISKQAAAIPQVFAEEQLVPVEEPMRRAAELRHDLSRGNLALAPGMADSGVAGPTDKASAIRAALSPTKVSRILNEELRPS